MLVLWVGVQLPPPPTHTHIQGIDAHVDSPPRFSSLVIRIRREASIGCLNAMKLILILALPLVML